jgi:hypothetical protein
MAVRCSAGRQGPKARRLSRCARKAIADRPEPWLPAEACPAPHQGPLAREREGGAELKHPTLGRVVHATVIVLPPAGCLRGLSHECLSGIGLAEGQPGLS